MNDWDVVREALREPWAGRGDGMVGVARVTEALASLECLRVHSASIEAALAASRFAEREYRNKCNDLIAEHAHRWEWLA